MVKQKETKPAKRRTQVENLSKPEKKLKAHELKAVKGGSLGQGIWIHSGVNPNPKP